MSEYEEEEVYVYLDFKGRIPIETFNSEVFFNIVNINSKHPLVQLGQSVFYGTYDDCVGTNVFFEENEESTSQTDIFSKKTPINLNYVTKQFKVLNMQWAKLPEDASADVVDDYDIKFKENYEVTLKKLDKDVLKVEDIAQVKTDEDASKDESAAVKRPDTESVPAARKRNTNNETPKQKSSDVVVQKCTKYSLLTYLAREPLKRVTSDVEFHIPDNLRVDYAYHMFRNKLLQENTFFDPIIFGYNKKTLEGAADINRCIRRGVLPNSDFNVNHETKSVVLNIQNFENLSLPMRYCALRREMKKHKRFITSATEKQLQEMTDLGVNMRDAYKIMKVIAEDLKKQILLKRQHFGEMNKISEAKDDADGDISEKAESNREDAI